MEQVYRLRLQDRLAFLERLADVRPAPNRASSHRAAYRVRDAAALRLQGRHWRVHWMIQSTEQGILIN